jgi:hypothetical protein
MGGLSNKFSEAKRATRPYVDDRLTQTEATVVAYGVAAGLLVTAAIFFIAALIVGAVTLFTWIRHLPAQEPC